MKIELILSQNEFEIIERDICNLIDSIAEDKESGSKDWRLKTLDEIYGILNSSEEDKE